MQCIVEYESLDFLGLTADFLLPGELDCPLFVAVLLVAPVCFFEKDFVFPLLVGLSRDTLFEVRRGGEIQALNVVRNFSRLLGHRVRGMSCQRARSTTVLVECLGYKRDRIRGRC